MTNIFFPTSILGGYFPIKSILGRINLLRKYYGLFDIGLLSVPEVCLHEGSGCRLVTSCLQTVSKYLQFYLYN